MQYSRSVSISISLNFLIFTRDFVNERVAKKVSHFVAELDNGKGSVVSLKCNKKYKADIRATFIK